MNPRVWAGFPGILRTLVLTYLWFLCFAVLTGCSNNTERDAERVRRLLDRGDYSEAERVASELVASRVAVERASVSLLWEFDVLVEAKIRNGKANEIATLEIARGVLRRKESLLGAEHPEVAISLHNLGDVHVERGEFERAVQLHQRALSIRTARQASNSIAASLEHLALPEIRLEHFDSARKLLAAALPIRQANFNREPLALARTLELQALLHRYSGDDYGAATPLVDRVIAIRARYAPDHPDTASVLSLKGDLLFLRGDIDSARRAWSEGLDLSERTLGRDHPSLSPLLRRLTAVAYAFGNRPEGRRLLDRALEIGNRRLSPCHPEATDLLNDDAQSRAREGDFATAQKLYERTIQVYERCYGPNHSQTATGVHNAGLLAMEMGDLAEAERLHTRAVQAWSDGLGASHPYVARGLDALAEVVALEGQTARARGLYKRALDIRRRALGPSHPDVAWTLTNLATTEADSGNVPLALSHVRQAIAIYQRSGAADEPDHFARVLELRGALEARLGNTYAARTSLTEALAERTRIFGESHPLVAETRAALAANDLARGDADGALTAALEAERSGREHLLFTVRYLPERQAMAYAAKRPRGLDLALTIAASRTLFHPEAVLDAVIRSRGVILDELAARPHAIKDSSPEVASLSAAMNASRQRFANLVVRSLQEPVSRAILDQARQEKEKAERALAERSVEARTELTRASAGLEEVRHALPPNAALVSFVRYDRTPSRTAAQPTRQLRPIPSYGAFIVRSGTDNTTFVSLGTAANLDALVKAWRDEASGRSIAAGAPAARAEQLYRDVATRLRRAAWDPLAPYLAGASRTLIVPDGLLNIVNFAALVGRDGRYLVEHDSVIHYLSTERDLLVPPREATAADTLLAVGGPAFDERSVAPAAPAVTRGSDCQPFSGVRFTNLPGTLGEVAEISTLWPTKKGANGVTLLSGRAASEPAVKRAIAGRRVIHFATHGFFLGTDCTSGLSGFRAVGGIALSSAATASAVSDNPLSLAGLALAGANSRGSVALDQDEGILTAEEIAGLNLQGTEWAVLSACDTGLGEIKQGEGVFGLRRAFQIAGVRTVIMSLWSVEDESTRTWMRALYEGRFQRHLDTAEAVRQAGLTVLRARRTKSQTTHPFYWAAFVAAGDWR